MRILALEASTTSAKAMLYDSETDKFESVAREYSDDYSTVEDINQAEAVYQQMIAVGREVLNWRSVDVIALSGTWHSVFLCDRTMRPTTPVYLWNYTGAKDICKRYRQDDAYVRDFYQRTGCMVNAIYPVFKLDLLRETGRDVDNSYIMSQGAYLTYRMTGGRVSTRCLSSGTGLMNIHSREYDPQILAEHRIQEWQLSRLVDDDASFPLTQEAANLLGVRSGIPVIPTNSDGGLNQVGVGAIRKGVATFSVGTSGAIRLSSDTPVIPDRPSTWCYLSPKAYLSGAATNGCCNCTDWVKQRFFPSGTSYEEIESGVTEEADAPVFLPFLFGERCPGWNDERRGGFLNVEASHTANDLYRAAQEGVLFNLYQCYKVLAEANGVPTEVMLSGGILKSSAWTQMAADIFGVPMSVNDVEQGSLLGAIILGMEQQGLIDDVRDYKPTVVRTIDPDPSRRDFYEEKFARYLECYENNC
ncbi:FGGY-family carbohydrate kinase [Actinobaculum sp. 352]|uniref:gluconokinase n=1 Tax=Actinobaculum sp. 352 TaxID=2490946 RepID=UPI000F7E910E|nr:FGGY-family carbohydrate kinase [Actinobaculum sp. 352]RTE49850.1 hypothetical protein EKN07_04825 [Actinobaculum sp. 352]